jgi:hypothetical protein
MKSFVYKEPIDNRENETVWEDLKKRTEDKCGYPDPITLDDTRIFRIEWQDDKWRSAQVGEEYGNIHGPVYAIFREPMPENFYVVTRREIVEVPGLSGVKVTPAEA